MRNWIVILALLAACVAPAAHAVTLVDRIVAVVNKEVITYSELNEAVGMAERQMRRQGMASPERPVLERQMLERLILDKAQLQLARETGIRIDELQLDRAVERIAQTNNMTLADFRRALEADGVSDAPDALQGGALGWRSQDRLPELFSEVLTQMKPGDVNGPLRSPAGFHIVQLIDRRGAGTEAPVLQTRIRHILVRTSETVSESEARRKLLDLRDRIVSGGADFAELARVHSDDA